MLDLGVTHLVMRFKLPRKNSAAQASESFAWGLHDAAPSPNDSGRAYLTQSIRLSGGMSLRWERAAISLMDTEICCVSPYSTQMQGTSV